MQIGMIGLGRMGASMVTRLLRGDHECVVHDQSPDGIARMVALGATGTRSWQCGADARAPCGQQQRRSGLAALRATWRPAISSRWSTTVSSMV